MNRLIAFLGTTLLLGLPAISQGQNLLTPGETARFNLGAGAFTTDIAVDVPANAEQLRIDVDGPANVDVDLALRFGEAFPVNGNAGVFGGVNWLFEHAHYRSISAGSDEWIVVTKRQHQPLRAGRWYLSVINFGNVPAQIDVRATLNTTPVAGVPISVAFDDTAACAAREATTTPWFDNTTVSAVGGNSALTRGEQRRNAFNHAIERVRNQLEGTAPIRIVACWKDLGGTATSATLASAGPTYLVRDDAAYSERFMPMPFLPTTYTWYASAPTAQLAGNDACRYRGGNCGTPDIFIQFNTAIDGDVVLGSSKFYYGFEPPAQGRTLDFVATAMHEITHGLGFTSLLNLDAEDGPVGEKFRACYTDGYCEPMAHDDIYTDSVVAADATSASPINQLSLEDRAAALTSGFDLRWGGEEAVTSPLNPRRLLTFPDNLPHLFAPAAVSPGSTLSHLNGGSDDELMTPYINNGVRSLGLARPMLSAVGWKTQPATIPAYATPYGGQWYDPARGGHGIDLHRVEGTPDTYMLVMYTFDASGLPEWYLSIGRIVDGVFRPGNDANGNSLWRTRYLFGPPPGQQADASVPGQIRIDFNQAERSPVCNDGTGRNDPLALMTFSLGNDTDLKWCLTQIVPEQARPDFDRTGHWYAGSSDSGWGVTTLGYGADGKGLFMVLYYPDSQGRPRWAAAQSNTFVSGVAMPLMQVQGYCRTCPKPASNPARQIGTVVLTLDEPEGSNGHIRFDAQFDGPGGGRFARDEAQMIRIARSEPTSD